MPNLTPFDNLIASLISVPIWSVVKLLVLFSLLLYIVFSLVIVKQVNLMTETLTDQLELPIKLMAAVHLALAILVLVMAFFVL